jgi:hypothetical protein
MKTRKLLTVGFSQRMGVVVPIQLTDTHLN